MLFLHIYPRSYCCVCGLCVSVHEVQGIHSNDREWEMGCGMGGLAEMAWAEHCECFLVANPCDWWLGSIKSLCWRPCQLLINPSKCLLHLGSNHFRVSSKCACAGSYTCCNGTQACKPVYSKVFSDPAAALDWRCSSPFFFITYCKTNTPIDNMQKY